MARPALRLRIVPRFPARIQGADGVGVARSGGVVTIRQDWSNIQQGPAPTDPSTYQMLLRDPDGGLVRIPGTTLAPVTWDNLPDKPSEFPPSPHTHGIPDIVNLQSSLDAKVNKTDVIDVAHGGSARATATAYGVICGGTTATGAHQSVAVGTSGHVLTSNGAGALPTFQAPALVSGAVLYNAVQSLSTSETAQARSNIAAEPLAQSGAGVGQIADIASVSGGNLVIPSGGTWSISYNRYQSGSGIWAGNTANGVVAGGTVIAGVTGVVFTGTAKRIA